MTCILIALTDILWGAMCLMDHACWATPLALCPVYTARPTRENCFVASRRVGSGSVNWAISVTRNVSIFSVQDLGFIARYLRVLQLFRLLLFVYFCTIFIISK